MSVSLTSWLNRSRRCRARIFDERSAEEDILCKHDETGHPKGAMATMGHRVKVKRKALVEDRAGDAIKDNAFTPVSPSLWIGVRQC